MTQTLRPPPGPAPDCCTHWIRRLRTADALPSALADRSVRAAIHEAPPACRPSPVEAWLFAAATGPGDGIDCAHVVGWLRLRRALGDDAGLVDPETARYWHRRLGVPPRSSTPRWARRVRSVARDAEPLGFGLSPRRVAAFCAHPAWVHPYLRCATFKAWLVAAEDPELAELPPPPSPDDLGGHARSWARITASPRPSSLHR
ncbi:MAG: hypothetical protein V9G18_22165 [Albidovulum sp.]